METSRNTGTDANLVLVCFAVREEARPFERAVAGRPGVRTLITGMGEHNADRAIRGFLAARKPSLVLTCGFAGGLNPELVCGSVIFSIAGAPTLEAGLVRAGARKARFHYASRVATTSAEKQALRQSTGADAVEMESHVIEAVCGERDVPCATVRVVLDTAGEDLPLDFNRVMTPDRRIDGLKLAGALVRSPGKVGALMRFQARTRSAAAELARVLARVLNAGA